MLINARTTMAFLFAPIRQFRQFDHETADQPRLFEDDSEKGFETNGMEVRDGELVVTSLNGSPGGMLLIEPGGRWQLILC